MKIIKKILFGLVIIVALFFIAIQFVPYGRAHNNPAVQAEPKWDNPQTRDLAQRACFDCHSNQTVWPWYSNIAPVSWLIQHDVDEARTKLNFSMWNTAQREARGAGREVQRGTMPQWYYVLLHPSANLTAAEKQALTNGLNASLGGRSQVVPPTLASSN